MFTLFTLLLLSAPLIVDPTAGALTEKMKAVCKDFGATMGMDVKVVEGVGKAVKSDAKSEPRRNKSCGRDNCMCCSSGNEGWNTKIASRTREKTRLCGNIASLYTMARSRPSPCLLLEVFKAALKDKSTRQSGSLPTLLITF